MQYKKTKYFFAFFSFAFLLIPTRNCAVYWSTSLLLELKWRCHPTSLRQKTGSYEMLIQTALMVNQFSFSPPRIYTRKKILEETRTPQNGQAKRKVVSTLRWTKFKCNLKKKRDGHVCTNLSQCNDSIVCVFRDACVSNVTVRSTDTLALR